MFDLFNADARRAVVRCQESARALDHDYMGTEHVLLGLIHEDEREGIVSELICGAGCATQGIRALIEEIIGRGKDPSPRCIPFTERSKRVLTLSYKESVRLGHDYIGPEHLLLGLLSEGEGVGGRVLCKAGLTLASVRAWVAGERLPDTIPPQPLAPDYASLLAGEPGGDLPPNEIPDYRSWTAEALRARVHANAHAAVIGKDFTNCADLLMALLQTPAIRGSRAAHVLAKLDADSVADQLMQGGPSDVAMELKTMALEIEKGQLPPANEWLRLACVRASSWAAKTGSAYVDTAHLLLACLDNEAPHNHRAIEHRTVAVLMAGEGVTDDLAMSAAMEVRIHVADNDRWPGNIATSSSRRTPELPTAVPVPRQAWRHPLAAAVSRGTSPTAENLNSLLAVKRTRSHGIIMFLAFLAKVGRVLTTIALVSMPAYSWPILLTLLPLVLDRDLIPARVWLPAELLAAIFAPWPLRLLIIAGATFDLIHRYQNLQFRRSDLAAPTYGYARLRRDARAARSGLKRRMAARLSR